MAATKVSKGVATNDVKNPPPMTEAEAIAGTDTEPRTMSAIVLKAAYDAHGAP